MVNLLAPIGKNTKKGFTLAEVLVTLAIIGVVAALTIPSLIQRTQDQQFKSAWKKAYSNFAQATNRIIQEKGTNLLNYCATNDNDCIIDEYAKYLGYTKHCYQGDANCWHARNAGTTRYLNGTIFYLWWSDNGGFILSDGTLVNIRWINPNCNDTANGGAYSTPKCGYIDVDINGFKPPNIIGKDIYELLILPDRVIPAPSRCWPGSTSGTNTGWGCSETYILNLDSQN